MKMSGLKWLHQKMTTIGGFGHVPVVTAGSENDELRNGAGKTAKRYQSVVVVTECEDLGQVVDGFWTGSTPCDGIVICGL